MYFLLLSPSKYCETKCKLPWVTIERYVVKSTLNQSSDIFGQECALTFYLDVSPT